MKKNDFFVRFWGVRGSLPVPGPKTVEFGGNTSCVEIRCGSHILIIDAGSGIKELGHMLSDEGNEDIDLLFSHSHFDHISGLPFFTPLFCKGRTINIWSGHLEGTMTTEKMVSELVREPFFPVSPQHFSANVCYKDFSIGDTLTPKPGITISTTHLNHPNGCSGFRVEWQGKSICYVSDTEHREGELDSNILKLIHQADIMIYDATYTNAEYPEFKGFGHSTWQEGVRLSVAADVALLVLYHHRPRHDDDFLQAMEKEAIAAHTGTIVAREGMVLHP
jgi:phosphoribosyl 1,2-cyclic phosphodiesterase